jgi:serine protease DegS
MKKLHSTHFLFGWALLGLIIAGLFLSLWPGNIKNGKEHSPRAFINTFSGPVSYADAVAIAAPAVVSIQAYPKTTQTPALLSPLLEQSKPKKQTKPNQGSGVMVDDLGHILTNYHVVSNADEIIVTLIDGRQVKALVVGADPDTDLAVITIEHKSHQGIRFADMAHLKVGDVVLAIGNPFGIGQTVTQGIISATGRDRVGLNTYENFIQTDAAINPGNSGGALINAHGEIVGINAAIFTKSGSYQGISFAIPIDMALKVVKQIIKHGGVIRGWLGVEGVDLNEQMLKRVGLPDVQGVLITDVFKNGPADNAGLKSGDIITHINQTNIRDTRDVLDMVAQGQPGDSIEISGVRQRQSFMTQATLGQRPQESR